RTAIGHPMAPAIPLTKSRRRIASPQCSEKGIIVAGQTGRLEVVKTALSNVRFGSKVDIAQCETNVRFTPKSGHWLSVSGCPLCAKSGHSALRQTMALFNNLVGAGQEAWRHANTKHLRCRYIDDELEFCRLNDWQICWFGAFKNVAAIRADVAIIIA